MGLAELIARLNKLQACQLGQGATQPEIEEAASALKVRLPSDYQDFLRRVGWASCGYFQLFGVGKDVPAHLELVSKTMGVRHQFRPHIPHHLVPLMNDGSGNYYCLSVDGHGKGKVVFWNHELDEAQYPAVVGDSFVGWLNKYLDDLAVDDARRA